MFERNIVFVKDHPAGLDIAHHHLTWADFDSLARGNGGADVVRRLRRAQRSRRLLLLRALMDDVTTDPTLYHPMPSPEDAWDLLARAQDAEPAAVELMLAHPYTGAWVAYTRRLVRKAFTSEWPLWTHIGHFHALAAAAAIRAGIAFEATIPVREGEAILPTLGMARLPADTPWSIAHVRGDADGVRVSTATASVVLPRDTTADGPGWWGMRRLRTQEIGGLRLDIRLDDLDPYRGLHEPDTAERTDPAEVDNWAALLEDAWRLIVECVPALADGYPVGFDSLVPRPEIPFRYLSGSTGETFGSAVIAKPATATLLASALVHEFQHSRLHALLHLVPLHENDPRQRFYTLWRDDPRPIGGVLHGVYAFFGVTAFWRALAQTGDRRAAFEFAYCRKGTWHVLGALRRDPQLTAEGRRFVDGIAERLEPWHDEPIPRDIAELAERAYADHHAGWRLRHLRPAPSVVAQYADARLSNQSTSDTIPLPPDPAPVPESDGSWPGARTELIRLALSDPAALDAVWPTIPEVTRADFDYVTGNLDDAIHGYQQELRTDPDRVASWVGLGLALSTRHPDNPAARTLLTQPELVRAVHRELRSRTASTPAPDELAAWIARATFRDPERNVTFPP